MFNEVKTSLSILAEYSQVRGDEEFAEEIGKATGFVRRSRMLDMDEYCHKYKHQKQVFVKAKGLLKLKMANMRLINL